MSDRLKAEREAATARRNLLTQDAIERTGITEEMIGELGDSLLRARARG